MLLTIVIGIVHLVAFIALMYGMFFGMARLSRRLMRNTYEHAMIANIVIDGSGAATVPVIATFTGVRGLPWWYAVAINNAKPLLVVERDGVRFRVIRTQQRLFSDIAYVDVRQATGTVNLELAFRDALLTFSANLGTVPLATHVLRLLPPSLPLSARASAIKARARE